jgi:hypothetical protein
MSIRNTTYEALRDGFGFRLSVSKNKGLPRTFWLDKKGALVPSSCAVEATYSCHLTPSSRCGSSTFSLRSVDELPHVESTRAKNLKETVYHLLPEGCAVAQRKVDRLTGGGDQS